jgi:hypothetical protein
VVPLAGLEPARMLLRGILRQYSLKNWSFPQKQQGAKTGQIRTKNKPQSPKNDNFLALFRSYKNRQKYNGSKKFHKKSGFEPDFFCPLGPNFSLIL